MGDLRSAGSTAQETEAEARFETIDGLVVKARLLREGDATWARFVAVLAQPASPFSNPSCHFCDKVRDNHCGFPAVRGSALSQEGKLQFPETPAH